MTNRLLLLWVFAALLVWGVYVLGQSELLLWDEFELDDPIVGEWNHWDLYGNTQNLGVLPEVIYDTTADTHVLHFSSIDSWRQRQGAQYVAPMLVSEDVLVFDLAVRRNTADTYFVIEPGRKQPNLINGRFGAVTSDYLTVWALPFAQYFTGTAYGAGYPGVPYSFEGIRVVVPNSPDPSWGIHADQYHIAMTLSEDEWHSFRFLYTLTSFELWIDSARIIALQGEEVYHSLDAPEDWIAQLGDGGSVPVGPTDLSVDNVLLLKTRAVILHVYDRFHLPFSEIDNLYEQFGEERLLACLDCCQGDLEAFLACLGNTEGDGTPGPMAHLVHHVVENEDGSWSLFTANLGDAAYAGPLTFSAGLSYFRGWVGEWGTRFFDFALTSVHLLPGMELETVFRRDTDGSFLGMITFPEIREGDGAQPLTLVIPMPEQSHIDFLVEMIQHVWTGVYDYEPTIDYVDLTVSGSRGCSTEGHFFIPMAPFFQPVR